MGHPVFSKVWRLDDGLNMDVRILRSISNMDVHIMARAY
jgi:hypothetical protein